LILNGVEKTNDSIDDIKAAFMLAVVQHQLPKQYISKENNNTELVMTTELDWRHLPQSEWLLRLKTGDARFKLKPTSLLTNEKVYVFSGYDVPCGTGHKRIIDH